MYELTENDTSASLSVSQSQRNELTRLLVAGPLGKLSLGNKPPARQMARSF